MPKQAQTFAGAFYPIYLPEQELSSGGVGPQPNCPRSPYESLGCMVEKKDLVFLNGASLESGWAAITYFKDPESLILLSIKLCPLAENNE